MVRADLGVIRRRWPGGVLPIGFVAIVQRGAIIALILAIPVTVWLAGEQSQQARGPGPYPPPIADPEPSDTTSGVGVGGLTVGEWQAAPVGIEAPSIPGPATWFTGNQRLRWPPSPTVAASPTAPGTSRPFLSSRRPSSRETEESPEADPPTTTPTDPPTTTSTDPPTTTSTTVETSGP